MPKAITNREGRSCLQCYDLKKDGESAEITLYGNVVKSRPLEWDGESIHKSEQNFIVEKEFLDDINALEKCRKLNLRVNSLGGDVHVALNIYHRLCELADNGTEVNCSVDGVAMSAGSIIICAANHVIVNESSLIMIHRCMVRLDGYQNADELRHQAEIQEEYDKVIASCYKRKTGKSEEEILNLMSRETYMTGKEAVELSFADELIRSEKSIDIVALANSNSLVINGKIFDLMGEPVPDNLPVIKFPDVDKINSHQTLVTNNSENGGKIMATNFEELLKENPELAAVIKNELTAKAEDNFKTKVQAATEEAAKKERERIAAIDKIAAQCSPELVEEAKFGENRCSAAELAYRMFCDNAEKGKKYLEDVINDAASSNTSKVPAAASPDLEVNVKTASLDFMHSVLCGEEK